MKLSRITGRTYIKCINESERNRALKLLSLLDIEVDDKQYSFDIAPYICIDISNRKALTVTSRSAIGSKGGRIITAGAFIHDNL